MGGVTGKKTCAVPECDRILYRGNRTGLCREHNHQQPYCECYQCKPGAHHVQTQSAAKASDQPAALAEQVAGKGVSLPPAPWGDS